MEDKYIRLVKLPYRVKGITVTDADGNYNVYINKNLAYEMQREALLHEIIHIDSNDLYSSKPVAVLEKRVRRCHKGR